MKREIILIFFIILMSLPIRAGSGNYGAILDLEGSARWQASGKTNLNLLESGNSLNNNPAGLYYLIFQDVNITYSSIYSKVGGIDYGEINFCNATMKSSYGIGYSYFRIAGIREAVNDRLLGKEFEASLSNLKIAIATKLSDKIAIGMKMKYLRDTIKENTISNLSSDIGLMINNNKKIKGSLLIKNIQLSAAEVDLPIIIESGISGKILDIITISGIIEIDSRKGKYFRIGGDYEISEKIGIQAGYLSKSKEITGGLSINHNKIKIEYGMTLHRDLGLTHRMTLSIMKF